MTKHTISEKVKDNLIYSNDVSKSLYTNIGFSKSPMRKGDSIADIAAKIFNLIRLQQAEHTKQIELDENFNFKLIEKISHDTLKTFTKIDEDSGKVIEKDSEKPKDEEDSSLGLGKIFSIYKFWKILNLGGKISKLFEFIKIFKNLKWIKNISSIPMNIVKGAFQIVKAAFPRLLAIGRFIPGPVGITARIGAVTATVYGLTDAIAAGESGGDYQKVVGGETTIQFKGEERKLTELSVGEVLEWGETRIKQGKGTAAGKYQIIKSTLEGLVKQGAVSKTEMFTPETQEKLFTSLLPQQAINYISGKTSGKESEDEAILAISKVWAAVPIPYDIPNRGLKAGQSYYAGDNVNKALMPVDTIRSALQKSKENKSVNMTEDLLTSVKSSEIDPFNITGEKLNKESVENIDIKKETDAHIHIQQVPTNYILGTNSSSVNFEFTSNNPIPSILQKPIYE
jgi:muramidase (phage lysozyme)